MKNKEIDLENHPEGHPLPKGRMTARLIDLNTPLGIAYERAITYDKSEHSHQRIHISFPRGQSRIYFCTEDSPTKFLVHNQNFLWMPENVSHTQGTESLVWDNFAIYPNATLLKKISSFPLKTALFKRTHLLNELIERLFHERVICREKYNAQLAKDIMDEIYYITSKEKRPSQTVTEAAPDSSHVELALRFIESNLFNPLSIIDIAIASHASVPTLYRQFKAELKMTPLEFQRIRRLDESLSLLRSEEYNISDVAILVGYEDLAAFSKAFKKHFGKSPGKYQQISQ